MEQKREDFVKDVLAQRGSKAELCRAHGISRPTGDKWLKRNEEGKGYGDQSHGPLGNPANKTSEEIERYIVDLRGRYPMLGAAKLHRIMKDRGIDPLPCVKTINRDNPRFCVNLKAVVK